MEDSGDSEESPDVCAGAAAAAAPAGATSRCRRSIEAFPWPVIASTFAVASSSYIARSHSAIFEVLFSLDTDKTAEMGAVLTRRTKGRREKRVKGKGNNRGGVQPGTPVLVVPPRSLTLALLSYSAFLANGTGFSCEVSVFISGVASTSRVRKMNIVETISVIVQANPPSMP